MAKTARNLMTGAVLTVALFSAGQAAAESDETTIVVRVRNYAEVADSVLSEAQEVASHIYAAAGVRTMWTATLKPVSDARRALHLTVTLLSREMEERMIHASNVGFDVLGMAVRPASLAYIFFHSIWEVASGRGVSAADMLGKVIAHEIGHLILPVNGHSLNGIMRATLNLTDVVQRFTPEQSQAIHTVLRIDDRVTGQREIEFPTNPSQNVLARR